MHTAAVAEPSSPAQAVQAAPPDPWSAARLLHRWLVEYNPVYLLSAALVLGGLNLVSSALVRRGALYGQLGVAAVAELYALALIAGAALLTRLGLRRPAVMLALLAVLYQADLTIHTETCAYLGALGVVATAAWLALFVTKLYALAAALRLRLSTTAVAVPTVAAMGAAILPHLLVGADAHAKSTLAAGWLFALFAFALWTRREVDSLEPLDAWGRQVLRRALWATWALWATLTVGHVLFWSSEWRISVGPLIVVAMLLITRLLRREGQVWLIVGATLLFVGLAMPETMSIAAAMAAVVLILHALRQPSPVAGVDRPDRASGPYRTAVTDPPPASDDPDTPLVFAPAERAARLRLLSGALCSVYLAVWTHGWIGGAWPAHVLVLDVAFGVAIAMLVWKASTRAVVVALPMTCLHWAAQVGHIRMPNSPLEWGLLCVGLGFSLLAISLLASWRLRHFVNRRPGSGPGPTHGTAPG